jgi:hypothetical protein
LFVLEGEKEEQSRHNKPLMGLFCSTLIKLSRKKSTTVQLRLKLNVHHIRSNVHMTSPTRQLSLSLSLSLSFHQWGFWTQFTIIKEEQKRQSLKDALSHHPKQKAFKKIVSCNGGLIKPTSPLLSSPLLSLISPLLLLLLLGPRPSS